MSLSEEEAGREAKIREKIQLELQSGVRPVPQNSRISLSSFVSYTRPQSTRPVWIKKKTSSKLKIRRHFGRGGDGRRHA